MKFADAMKAMVNVNGASFVGLDTETVCELKGGKGNPFKGRVTKRMEGASVMVFQNKKSSSYANMVERRLIAEGKDPKSFQLQPRKWGNRIPETPFIEHFKDGKICYYLEVIFLKSGKVTYLVDGVPTDPSTIQGLETEREESKQGGLDNKVIIRSFKLESITALRIDGTEYK